MPLCHQVNTCHSPGLKERFGIEDTAIILFRDRQVKCHHPSGIKTATLPSPHHVVSLKFVFKHLLCVVPMQMYKYANLSRKGANNKGALQQFALKGYEHFEALPVPQPQGFWAAAMKELFATQLVSTPGVLCKLTIKAVHAVHPLISCFWLSACFSSIDQ